MLRELLERYPALKVAEKDIIKATGTIIDCYEKGGKLLLCGNGGSCADCDHIVGELMKGFHKKRPLSAEKKAEMKENSPLLDDRALSLLQQGLPAISLSSITALNSAVCNDLDARLVYAQSLMALGKKGDILIAISTSGRAENVCLAAELASAIGMTVISLTGMDGGRLQKVSHICIRVPEEETFKVQELQLPVYHYICAFTEEHFFGQ